MKKSDVIEYFGGQGKAAKALRIHPSSITRWGEDVPDQAAYTIELLTRGALKTDETLRILSITEHGGY